MAASVIQTKAAAVTPGTSLAATFDSPIQAGNRLAAVFKDNDGTSTITLPSGWAWAPNAPWAPAVGRQFGVAYKTAWTDGTESETVTFSSTVNGNKELVILELNDCGAPTVGVQTTTANTLTSKTLTTTGTLPQANGLAIAVADQSLNNGGEVSVDQGFTLRETGGLILMMVATKVTAATTALTPTFVWTTARAAAGYQAVFPEATPPPPVEPDVYVYNGTVWVPHSLTVS